MSDGITTIPLSVLAGITARGLFAIRAPNVCQLSKNIIFEHGKAFVEPTPGNKAAFQDLITRLGFTSTHNRLLITGHTDSTGEDAINDPLSDRRARAVQAVVEGNTGEWETLFTEDTWGARELGLMTAQVGEPSITPFQGAGNAAARAGLYTRYFARLLGGRAVPAHQTADPPILSCGEHQLLRGTTTSFSRDPAQPPILGDFPPNRRSEFFFFDNSPASARANITCNNYPTWTAACSLRPPPPPAVTVTIAPLEGVRVGGTAGVQITINPSPLTPGTELTLSLSTTGGTGEARFDRNNLPTLNIRASDSVIVRGVTASSLVDNINLTARLAGQPATAPPLAQEAFTVTAAVFIHVQFEVFSLTATPPAFVPLPAGVEVAIMDFETFPQTDDQLVTQNTDASGRVFFNLSALTDPDEANPDIFFLVRTNGRSHAGHTLPAEWSTKGWLATDGSPGFIDDYTGTPIGTPTAPRVFRIGLDFHAKFTFLHPGRPDPQLAPQRIPVEVHSARPPGGDPAKQTLFTNAGGEVHGVVFNISPGDDFYFAVRFEMEDSSINLPLTRVEMELIDVFGWRTFTPDADAKPFPNQNQTSIGTQTAPVEFHMTASERNVGMYFLKILREWSTFLSNITATAGAARWDGVQGLVLFRRTIPPATANHSFPVGEVHIEPPSHFSRAILVHELSHQIMWKMSNISTAEIAIAFFPLLVYVANHDDNKITTPLTALFEGWCDLFVGIFGVAPRPFAPVPPATGPREVFDSGGATTVPIDSPPNRGESVEGAFTSGLLSIFDEDVVTPAVAGGPRIPESRNGDPAIPAWLTNGAVRDRFNRMIWRPLQLLDTLPLRLVLIGPATVVSNIENKTSTAMIAFIRLNNLSLDWHALQRRLQDFNMAMIAPTVTAISRPGGPPGGGPPPVTITGTEFTRGTTTVTIGGNPATNVNVTRTNTLTADPPPGTLGPADVVVTTPAGSSAPLTGAYVYAVAPVITSIHEPPNPPTLGAVGPTTGGTRVKIIGTDFQPDAKVFFGGLPPNGVQAQTLPGGLSTEIDAESPLFPLPQHQPGPVEVVVENPDLQRGSLNPGFEYILGPAPTIVGNIDPPQGPVAGGTPFIIEGANFQVDVEVFFGIEQANIDRAQTTDRHIEGLTPPFTLAASPGPTTVRVVNRDGQEVTLSQPFTYIP